MILNSDQLRPIGMVFEVEYPPTPNMPYFKIWKYRIKSHEKVNLYGRDSEVTAENWEPLESREEYPVSIIVPWGSREPIYIKKGETLCPHCFGQRKIKEEA